MNTTNRAPHAPAAVLPELDEFLRPCHVHFRRSEGRQSLERYLPGLLTEHNNKPCDTIAPVVPGTDQRGGTLRQLPSEADAVLVFDDTGFAKQGQCSVGV